MLPTPETILKSTLSFVLKEYKKEEDKEYILMKLPINEKRNVHYDSWVKRDDVYEKLCVELDGEMTLSDKFHAPYYINKNGMRIKLTNGFDIYYDDLNAFIDELKKNQ